ncbi:hypothetical protein [Pseudoalteromonas peptidolytica]|uniref:Uncharacterized protein n=1 Tax=Pseudoalteromonas peptidolytica F12-50-A1 TaxID=1315280 RepID=A0A8I0MYK8_9GAMM|nr:hypothetical protein [Pseudoalteromonas peptidolytica]MBE0348231.1 hypothetical protein [Pseudoalteromonas peptidolytica F12-50-A1]GEK11884.1 hypothetical protein PPE03_41330 [Pseudoalteromonas peptidolytica]
MKDNTVLHCIAGFLNAYDCKTLDEVDGALQELIEAATETQSQYRNGIAEQASSMHTVN